MSKWIQYKAYVQRTILSDLEEMDELSYWKNYLFSQCLTYLIPLSLIAIVPGIYWSFVTGYLQIAVLDFTSFLLMCMLILPIRLSIHVRKWLFIACFYVVALTLLWHLGLYGPALVYLLTASIFGTILFSKKFAFVFASINTTICALFSVFIHWEWVVWHNMYPNVFAHWIVITTNLVFVSFIFAAVIPELVGRLQQVINKQQLLQSELVEKRDSLEKAVVQLRQKNGELEQFAYVASHDLQEPLRMVTGFLTQLDKKYAEKLDDKGQQYLHFALDGATRMRKVILEILEFSRIGLDKEPMHDTDVQAMVEEILWMHRKLIRESAAQITFQGLPTVFVHQALIRTLLTNLIINAIKYHSVARRPEITISAKELDGSWLFYIADNGVGIEPENQEIIFQLFKRLSIDNEQQGSGIGLAICKKICNLLGGDIWVSSRLGYGSTFYFTLPVIGKRTVHSADE